MTTSQPTEDQELRELEGVAANIVHQIGDALYEALPKDVAHQHFVDARQATNDVAIDFAKMLIQAHAAKRVQAAEKSWQPMELAPTDGEEITVLVYGIEINEIANVVWKYTEPVGWCWVLTATGLPLDESPFAWRPLTHTEEKSE